LKLGNEFGGLNKWGCNFSGAPVPSDLGHVAALDEVPSTQNAGWRSWVNELNFRVSSASSGAVWISFLVRGSRERQASTHAPWFCFIPTKSAIPPLQAGSLFLFYEHARSRGKRVHFRVAQELFWATVWRRRTL
jgi:hypothetical protein